MKHPPPPALAFLPAALEELEAQGLLRVRDTPRLASELSFCSNDYLGIAATGVGTLPPMAPGAGASRLVSGERQAHVELERAVSSWLEAPSALAFSSGYAANVGTIAALARPGDLVISDELNHASLIDGCRLSRARVVVTPHLDLDAVERALKAREPGSTGNTWVVTESYFSMDADSPDLARLRELTDRHKAGLVVDEAHSLGVLGPDGRGLCAAVGVVPDVLLGTFGKAFGHAGAFAAGCVDLTDWLWNRARSFVFSTGMSPQVAQGARAALALAVAHPELRERVAVVATALRAGLAERGAEVLGYGHIIPWVVGDAGRAVRLAQEFRAAGVHVQAIRPPTVPRGRARLRLTVTARHDLASIEYALAALRTVDA
ncbi:MAG: 8-amino-7-oxononanoate synthase [Polyangiaceae bacterium]